MKRKWESGDVALVTFDNATGNQRSQGINRIETRIALVDTDHVGDFEPADAWFVLGTTSRLGATWECVHEARPLVVIDYEDREQVERLRDVYDVAVIRMNQDPDPRDVTPTQRTTAMQAALREFANPTAPKPDEPTGLRAPPPPRASPPP